ncbi:hypothetical protein ACIOJG_37345 [Streptomyces anulatus]
MLARVRSTVGRAATVAGAVVLAGGLGNDVFTLPGAAAAVVAAGVGLATNPRIVRAPESVRWTAISLYAAPHTACALVLVGERLAPDGPVSLLVQAGVVALWTGATWMLRPGLTAQELVDEAVAQELAEAAKAVEEAAVELAAPEYDSPAARWWGETFAVEGGIAPGTVLLDHQQVSERCVALVIGTQKRGQPVPDISKPGLSAAMDLPEDLIDIGPVPGRGAGVRLLVLGQRPVAEAEAVGDSDAEVWAEIAATAMPGVELIEANTYEVHKELT